ncbi:MAG TPA: PAS domain S-box protein [Enhygromyxa sp.]|nr:PAS domain S-box protein [Enhygromyxa sp.]
MHSTSPSDETFRLLVEAAPNAIVVIDEDGHIILVNSQTEKLFGYSRDELVGRLVEMLVPERFRSTHPGLRAGFFGEARARPMGAGRDLYGLRKDGTEFPVEIGLNPIRTERGMLILSAIVDITERKRAERRFRLAIESAPSGMVMVDQSGQIVLVNSQAEKLFGYTREELIGRPVEMLVPERFRREHPDFRSGFFHDPESRPMGAGRDLYGRRKDGTEFPVEIGLNPIETDEGVLALSAIVDITERKLLERELRLRLEELAAADRQKDEFLATLAHELRNPLAPIRNAMQILKLPAANDHMRLRAQEMIDRQLHHMVRLVDDLLDVSRIIIGRIELRKECFDLSAAVTRAVETAEPLIEARGHELIVSMPPEPITVNADLVRLSQIISNLLTNAAKYTPKPDRIWLSAEQDGNDVILRIRDQGTGIEPSMLGRIFQLFVQADASPTRAQGGLGIGLTLVKQLVELHNGTVTATSEGLGRGSEFIVRFPADTDVGGTLGRPRVSEGPPARERGERRVLIVDDNVDAAESIAMLLQVSGFSVRCVYDGNSALTVASAYHPDVIILDIGLPDISGYDVARRLRAQRDFQRTPIVAVTGYGQQGDRLRSREAGIDFHMTKPVDPNALQALLEVGGVT